MSTVRNFCRYAAILPAFLLPVCVDAATLSVGSGNSQIAVGSTVVAYVQVDSEGVAINNAEGTLTFPTDIFDVVSVSQSPSIFTLWIQSPSYGGGGVSFNGGLPAPGYTGSNGRLFSVTLRAKAPGVAALAVAGGAVRANDGLGTDVLRTSNAAIVTVAAPAAAPAPAVQEVSKPAAIGSIAISSQTHPQEDSWYSSAEASLQWKVPAGADAVQTLVSKNKGATPSVIYRPAIAQKTTSALEDGVWYFNLRAHTAAGWGPISSYRLQVDTTPPVLGRVKISYNGDDKTLVLSAVAKSGESRGIILDAAVADEMSGVDRLEVVVDGKVAAAIPADSFNEGTYTLPITLTTGEHSASLRVTDNAGNQAESEETEFSVLHQPAWIESLWGALSSMSLSPMWLLLIAALALSSMSLLMNFILWKMLRRSERTGKARAPKSVLSQVQRETKLSLQALKKNLQKQDKSIQKAHMRADITPQDTAYLKKVRGHLAEAEAYLDEKMKEVDKA